MTILDKARWAEAYKNKRPENYEEFIQVAGMYHGEALETLVKMIMAPAEPLRVLELGVGTGMLTEKVLARFPGARVLGVDGSSEMLALAKGKLAPWADRFAPACSSFEEYPWDRVPAGSYDLIMTSFALHHMDHGRYPEFFSRFLRLLAPGGQLLVADYIRSRSQAVHRHYEDIWVDIRVRQLREKVGIHKTKEEMSSEHEKNKREEGDNPAPLRDLLERLEEAGFSDVDCHWKQYCLAIYGGFKPE